jgi:hypothetical protein
MMTGSTSLMVMARGNRIHGFRRMAMWLKKTAIMGLLALGSWSGSGCQETLTTSLDGDFIPISAVTVEARLPFSEFADSLSVWGGYGQPYQLATEIVAQAFEGSLDARTLVAWGAYPRSASVRDSTGTIRTDTLLTFVGGKVVAHFDTVSSVQDGPVALAVGAIQDDWDYQSVAWDVAVDSVGDRQPWPEPGAGPVIPMTTAEWDPAESDSAVFELDSAAVALWSDSASARRGMRMDAVTEGVRLDLSSVSFSLTTRPSSHLDTLVDLSVGSLYRTFVYQPQLQTPEGAIRVGGVPAWRTVFEMNLPTELDGPPELCAKVTCPLTLTANSLISATLVLHTKAPPPAFQPTDSLYLDVRPVLEPSRLPKSPLGTPLVGIYGVQLPPEDFGENDGVEVGIPLVQYVAALIRAKSDSGLQVPRTFALLSAFEPLSLYFVSFDGPGTPTGPELRLILTVGEEVLIR